MSGFIATPTMQDIRELWDRIEYLEQEMYDLKQQLDV